MHNMISSSPTLTNCTFSGNEAGTAAGFSGHGGGMFNWSSSSLTVTNCMFSQNSAGAWEGGGGMYNLSCSPTVANCIFWSNLPSEIHNNNGYAIVTYCDVLDGYAGEGNIDTAPLFVDADGPDDTVGTADDNLRLLAGSPCIDAGDNTAVPIGITTDLDGKPRFSDDPGTADTGKGTSPIVDMGAYEFTGGIAEYHPADTDNNCVISMLEILGYIDEWAVGNVTMLEVLEGIDLWAAGSYYWDPSDGKFKPGEEP